MQLKNN